MPGNPLDSSLVKTLNVAGRPFKRCATRGPAICRFLRRALHSLPLLLWAVVLTPSQGYSQADPEDAGPLLLSISPLTGRPGNLLKVEVRGNRLDGVYAVWSDTSGITGRVLSVDEVKDLIKPRVRPSQQEIKPIPVFRALIDLQIDATTSVGVHSLRLVSHRGVSNAFSFPVVDAPVTVEAASSHQTIGPAQPATLPGFISGKLGEPGEVDFYSFQARKGQELRFEVVEGQRFDPSADAAKFSAELALYHAAGSWFDPDRPTRVLFEEERSSDLMAANPGGTYKFSEDGQYFLQISGLFGQGCADCTYQLRAFPSAARAESTSQTQPVSSEWLERSLARHLTEGWTRELEARSVRGPEASANGVSSGQASFARTVANPEPRPVGSSSHPLAVSEREPNDRASQSESISIPAVIEGTIERPGDLDSFKFNVEAGQKLAFEVETSDVRPPYFNPRIGVVDSQDNEVFSNVERRLSMYNNNAVAEVYLKGAQAKATHSFERAGEYVLQIRDVTSRYGNSNYRYRILVRPQIPHVGEISVIPKENLDATPDAVKRSEVNRVNLVRNAPKKLLLVASYEEGFTGDLSFTFTGLPEGVQAFPAVQFNEGRAPLEVTQNPDTIAPKQQKTAMVLLASPEAPLTKEPRTVQLRCQLIDNGMLGPSLVVREFPLMVVEGAGERQAAKQTSTK
jgi:hypothetical protein